MYNIKYSKQTDIDLQEAISHKNKLFIIRVYHASVDYINKFNQESK